jgi:hypothetical protein
LITLDNVLGDVPILTRLYDAKTSELDEIVEISAEGLRAALGDVGVG